MKPVRHRDLILSLKYSTIEACFSVPMLNLTMPNFPFVIGFIVACLQWPPWAIGLVAALPHICNFLQPPLSRWLEKRLSLLRIMQFGFFLSGFPWLIYSYFVDSEKWGSLIFSLMLGITAMANSVTSVAWSVAISELVPPRISGRFFGTRNLVFGTWTLLAVLAAGVIVDLGNDPAYMFGWIFLAAGIARLMGLVFLTKMKFPANITQQTDTARPWSDLLAPLTNRNYLLYIAFVALWGFFLNLAMPFYAVFLMRRLEFQVGEVLLLTTIGTIGGLATLRAWGWLSDHFGNKPVQFVAAGVWTMIGLIAWALAGPRWQDHLYLAFIIIGGTTAGFQLCQFNLMIKLIPTKRYAHISVFLAVTSLATALGPIAGGAVLQVLPTELGVFLDQPFGKYHLLFLVSFLGCALSLAVLRQVHESEASRVQNVWVTMWKMPAFNPLLAIGTAAALLITPRGMLSLARSSVRSIRRQIKSLAEVGTEIVTESQSLFRGR